RVDLDLLVLEAGLHRVRAMPVERGERQVVLETPALLALVLKLFAAAEVENRVAVRRDRAVAVGECHGTRIEVGVLVRDVRVVEEALARELVAQVDAGLVVLLVARERRSVLIADVRDLAFGAVLGGELEQVIVPGEEVDLAEGQVLVERGAYRAEQPSDVGRHRARRDSLTERDGVRRLEVLRFVGEEEMHPVADDRTAECDAVLLLIGLRLVAGSRLERIGRAPGFGGLVVERFGLEFVLARARHGDDRGAAQLVELCLVVRRDDLVFADGELRKWIAACERLAAHATAQHVVLLADAVDEYVDAIRRLGAAANLTGRTVRAGRKLHAGHDIDEREEVARVLWQSLDLLRRHVGCNFRSARLAQRGCSHRHRLDVLLRGGEPEVQARVLTDLQGDQSRDRAGGPGHFDFVRARRQAGYEIVALLVRLDAPRESSLCVGRRDSRSRHRLLARQHMATQRPARRLRINVWCGGEQASGNSRGQQRALRLPRERGLVFHDPSPTSRRVIGSGIFRVSNGCTARGVPTVRPKRWGVPYIAYTYGPPFFSAAWYAGRACKRASSACRCGYASSSNFCAALISSGK